MRGGDYLDGLVSCSVEVDGSDSTEKLIRLITKTKHRPQLQYIILDGIAFGGFNVIDISLLHKKTKLPVIVVIRKNPDIKRIFSILKKIKQEKKIKIIKKAGAIHKIGKIYVQLAGICVQEAKEVLSISCSHSLLPEPIRLSHLIASGIVDGESRGRA